jgi:hypothetical protein
MLIQKRDEDHGPSPEYARVLGFDPQIAIAQIDALLAEITPQIRVVKPSGRWFGRTETEQVAMKTRATALIERLAPPASRYTQNATVPRVQSLPGGKAVIELAGILSALRDDYSAGYMYSVEQLIHADVFADFLEMAEELSEKGYKDAAAVIVGSVLEEHLRKLAGLHQIVSARDGRPVRAAVLNEELAKAVAYNKLAQKSVTAWLDLRNNAAHGRYDEYDRGQVAAMIRDVRSFIDRHPA